MYIISGVVIRQMNTEVAEEVSYDDLTTRPMGIFHPRFAQSKPMTQFCR
jgi:hypothetical protein